MIHIKLKFETTIALIRKKIEFEEDCRRNAIETCGNLFICVYNPSYLQSKPSKVRDPAKQTSYCNLETNLKLLNFSIKCRKFKNLISFTYFVEFLKYNSILQNLEPSIQHNIEIFFKNINQKCLCLEGLVMYYYRIIIEGSIKLCE